MWFTLLHLFGVEPRNTSTAYNFWSGIGSDLGELGIITGLVTVYRKHNCHVYRCWRVGKMAVPGTPYVVCHRHHPAVDAPITSQVVLDAHEVAREQADGAEFA